MAQIVTDPRLNQHIERATRIPIAATVGPVAALRSISSHMRDQSSTAAARAAAVAARQHGVITTGQLLTAGLRPSTIHRWTHAGHLHPLHRGVYAVGHPNVPRDGRYLAAVLACGEAAALSHTSSARHGGLDRTRATGTNHVSIPAGTRRRPAGLLVHRSRTLEPQDITRRFGVPTTTATRTLFDLTHLLSAGALRVHFERAEYLDVLDRDRLHVLLDGASGRKGLGSLRALAAFTPLPLSLVRSRLEGIVLTLCRTYSLPLPGVNVALLGYEVDFFWADARFVVEADGGHHRGPQRDADNERDIALGRAGHLVRRYSGTALKNERAVAAEILTILRERLGPAPRRNTR